jgi:hypothetical protein
VFTDFVAPGGRTLVEHQTSGQTIAYAFHTEAMLIAAERLARTYDPMFDSLIPGPDAIIHSLLIPCKSCRRIRALRGTVGTSAPRERCMQCVWPDGSFRKWAARSDVRPRITDPLEIESNDTLTARASTWSKWLRGNRALAGGTCPILWGALYSALEGVWGPGTSTDDWLAPHPGS